MDNFNLKKFLTENKLTTASKVVIEEGYSDYYDSEASKIVGRKLRGIVDIFSKSKADELAEIEAAIQAAEQETGTQVTSRERSYLKDQASLMRMQDIEMER